MLYEAQMVPYSFVAQDHYYCADRPAGFSAGTYDFQSESGFEDRIHYTDSAQSRCCSVHSIQTG